MNEVLLNNFFSVLNSKVKFVNQVKKEYSKTLASDFNALNFWNIDENKVSQIIAFFLNPNESHGQEELYLKIFLKRFQLSFPTENLNGVEVITEKRTHNNRRIDIYITDEDSGNVIGFENKIYNWTADQYRQVDDYIDFLSGISKNKKFTLIYLAPKNKKLSEYSFNRESFETNYTSDNLKLLNYEEDLIPLIHDFAINSENDRVRSFLLDFERKLKNLYMGNSDINEKDIVKNYVIESKDNLDTSFKIFNNIPALKNELKERFYEQMMEISNELHIPIDENRNRFYLDKLGSNKIAVNFEGGGLIYGIVRNVEDPDKKTYPEIESLFTENFQVSYWWPMWRWMFQQIEYTPDFWQAVIDGSAKNTVKDFVSKISSANFKIEG